MIQCIITGSTNISCSTLTVISAITVNPICGNHGSITISISGTNPNYIYILKDNNGVIYDGFTGSTTSHTFSNLPAGSWNVTIIDSAGNIAIIITPLIISNLFYTNTSIIGTDICLTISGGTLPYTILIDDIPMIWNSGQNGTQCFSASCTSFTGVSSGGTSSGDTVHHYDKIVVVVFENHSYNQIMLGAAPNFNTLANDGVLFTNSHGIGHPSQPNYLHLFAGDDQGVTNDTCPPTGQPYSSDNIFKTAQDLGLTYKAYSENLGSAGNTACSVGGVNGYWRKHAPWTNFNNFGSHGAHEFDFSTFPSPGLYNSLPNLSFVIPNQVNDMHQGSISAGNTWLQQYIFPYATWCVNNNSLLIVTFDEDNDTPVNKITTILVGANIPPGQINNTNINHHNVLRTIAQSLDPSHTYSYPGNSENVDPIMGIWEDDINPDSRSGLHTITIYDLSGCSATTTVNITCNSPTIILDIFSGTTCINDGYIQVHATGGTPTYTYYAINGLTTINNVDGIFTNLFPGTWQINAVDSLGFSTSILTINLGTSFYANIFASIIPNTFCFIITGATEPIYAILDGSPFGIFSNSITPQCFSAHCGSHTFTLLDSNNCNKTTSINVSCSTLFLILDVIHNPSCSGSTDGYIIIHATGGSTPYIYHLTDNFGNTYPDSSPTIGGYTFSDLNIGVYTITVTDALGNISTLNTITLVSSLVVSMSIPFNLSGETVGTICTTISGGSGIYNIEVINLFTGIGMVHPITDTTFCFTGNCGIEYSVEVIDLVTNCSIINHAIIPCEGFSVVVSYTNPTCFDYSTLNGGTITIEATGGTTPYTYIISNGLITNSYTTNIRYTFTGLSPGVWTVIVNDSGGLIYSYPISINLIDNS